MIVIWSGSAASIPAGWALCDGTNGTPNLRDRFVVGAGSTYAVGATGGAASGTTSAAGAHSHGGTTGSTALTIDQIPSHTHGIQALSVGTAGATGGSAVGNGPATSGATGGGLAHNHTISTQAAHTHTLATLPPYFALCYIMRTGAYLPGTGGGGGGSSLYEVENVATTTYTLTVANSPARAWKRFTGNGCIVSIPDHADEPIPIGTEIYLENAMPGGLDGDDPELEVVAAGVALIASTLFPYIGGLLVLRKVGENQWHLTSDIT
jgi:hypothetical protein